MDAFQVNEESLEDFYNLKTLNPINSWAIDSQYEYDLSHWQNDSANIDNSYDILKDLTEQQRQAQFHTMNRKNNTDGNTDADNIIQQLDSIRDPLNNGINMKQSLSSTQQKKDLQLKPGDLSKYLINKKEFDVKRFLRDIHSEDTFDDLTRSLDSLDHDIELQSTNLKHLVQDNFTRYVKIKKRLDQIYQQFSERSNSTIEDTEKTNNLNANNLSEKVDASIRATTLKLKPLLDTSSKINNYQLTKQFIEENKRYFNLPRVLNKFLANNDYQNFILEYSRGNDLYIQLKQDYLIDIDDTSQSKVIETIWSRVEKIIQSYREQTWKKLIKNDNNTNNSPGNNNITMQDKNISNSTSQSLLSVEDQLVFLPLISKLLDLKIDENPIIKWIDIKLNNFEANISVISDHIMNKILIAQGNILKINIDTKDNINNEDNDGVNLSYYLSINQLFIPTRSVTNKENTDAQNSNNDSNSYSSLNNSSSINKSASLFNGLTDSPVIIEMWLLVLRYINELGTIAKRFVELWEHIERFLDGTYQSTLVNNKKKDNILVGDLNTIDNFKQIIELNENQITNIRTKGEKIVHLLCDNLLNIFQSSQESLRLKTKNTKKDSGLPTDYGFLPPRSNGLSCLRYLPLILEPLLNCMTQLAQLGISSNTIEETRNIANLAIDRCVGAISSTKLRDISRFYKLEDWNSFSLVREPDNETTTNGNATIEYSVTQFPDIVLSFQQYSIKTIKDILFSFERLPILNGISIVNYPSKKLLTGVEIQQIISLEAVLEAILKNAAKDKDKPRTSHTLLTLTNLQYIREYTFPETLEYFDEAFEWNLKEKPLEIFNLLGKMESSIFGNYLSDLKINLRDILEEKFHQINWPSHTSNSFRVGDYIIEALMLLVTIHSECFRIGPQLINKILKETQLFIARYLFEAFKPYIGNISSDGLLQVCVDMIYFQKVLGPLLEQDTKATLLACLQNCFQNKVDRLEKCIKDIDPIVNSNLKRTCIQFAAFK